MLSYGFSAAPRAIAPPDPRGRVVAAVLPLVFALLALLAWLTPARAELAAPASGSLLLRSAVPDAAPLEAPLMKTDVGIDVSGPTARATVTQAFRNTTDRWVEGTYVYPLPDDAAVDTMKLVVGDRVIVADVRERAAARRTYEAARAAGQSAALLEQERPNVFTNAVANIGPGETVLVQIEYQQKILPVQGTSTLRLPLVVAPRYNPAPAILDVAAERGGSDPVPDRDRITPPVLDPARHLPVNPVTVHVRLRAGFPIGAVRSATHKLRVEETGPDERLISLADGAVPADRDFELTWSAAISQAPTLGLFRERVGQESFLLGMVTPPAAAPARRQPRDITFVIDNSGSMQGASMRQAKASLLSALARLDAEDRFNVIRFDDTMDVLFPEGVPADAGHLHRAEVFVAGLEAAGGTEMLPPLKAALADPHPEETGRVRQIVFLTDGAIGNEEQIFAAIAQGRGRSRLFMIGIGSAPNIYLMRHAAELGRGSFTAIGSVDQVAERTRELFEKLESPVVTDLVASFSEGGVEVTPTPLPDLYRGEPVVFSAKGPPAHGTLTLTGRIGDTPWRQTLPLAEAAEGRGISKVWARAKIDEAETARITGRLTAEAADAAILRLALDHKLMTRLTSLVAVDATPRRPAGTPFVAAALPLNLPAGWDFASVFGPELQAPEARPLPPHDEHAGLDPATVSAVPHSVSLPQTATGFEARLLLGLLLLGLGLLLAPRARRAR